MALGSHRYCYIFGYGSLVHLEQVKNFFGKKTLSKADYHYCHLHGYQRVWNVAMDNRIEIPGYNKYVHRNSGTRFDGHICFVNIEVDPNNKTNGVILRLNSAELEKIRRREANYCLVDVSESISFTMLKYPVYASVGLPEAKERYRTALEEGTAVIQREYLETIDSAFKQISVDFYQEYLSTKIDPKIKILDLKKFAT